LNEGLSEGVSYRGRLQISLKTEIVDNQDGGPSMVEVESTLPVADVSIYIPRSVTIQYNTMQCSTVHCSTMVRR